jgi:Tfp pilus assembly protein PilO
MRRYSRREQILIGACAIAVLWFGLPMLWGLIRSGTPSAAVSSERLRAARQMRTQQAAALAQLQDQMERVARRQPPAALPAQVMAALDRRAREDGIELREVRPQPPQLLEGATGVPLQLSFSAPFPKAARFLTRLRVAPNGLAVDRVVIAAAAVDSDQVMVQARVLAFSTGQDSREGSRRG